SGGKGLGRPYLAIHPTRQLVYASIERQNQLIVYKLTADGDLIPEPLFTKATLADPAHKFPVQSAGPIHIHPNGRFVYLGNRSGVTGSLVPGVEEAHGQTVFCGGECKIRALAIYGKSREPTGSQHSYVPSA